MKVSVQITLLLGILCWALAIIFGIFVLGDGGSNDDLDMSGRIFLVRFAMAMCGMGGVAIGWSIAHSGGISDRARKGKIRNVVSNSGNSNTPSRSMSEKNDNTVKTAKAAIYPPTNADGQPLVIKRRSSRRAPQVGRSAPTKNPGEQTRSEEVEEVEDESTPIEG